eukprot:1080788-Lingulodinium_polyedra.AAC.1
MSTEQPWPRVQDRPRNIIQRLRHCAIGQRAVDGCLIKKPTQVWTNSPDMASVAQGISCHCRRERAHAEGADARR